MKEDPALRQTLEKLHSELENTRTVDHESRQLLKHLMADVQELLEREDEQLPEQNSVSESLRESIDEFEVSHPTLTITIGKLLDILSQNGL